MKTVLQIGGFAPEIQAQLDAEFRCLGLADLEREPHLANDVGAIVTRSNQEVPEDVVRRLPALEIIATCGVGYDLIPRALAASRGIVVANTPDVLNAAVAELCIGSLLALLRRLPQADRYVRMGRWTAAGFPLATSLAGKHVGIAGMGRIGKEIARRLEMFGVALAYHGRTDQNLAWRYEADLATLARDSDILIAVAPGGAETKHLIDGRVLDALGPAGYFVNVARGSLVDEQALLAALERGDIAGAALDVFDNEPDIDPRFFALDNVMLTPHVGSATHETRAAMAQLMLDNVRTWFRSGRALTPVEPD
ncbi:2-hydroxyacid dehydrogenase [Massilia luteola]|uniref:2-hydroxyacid dehydrogenase n=1 Tax=Massilia luteola TaxID=3081751 RepID=UPI002ACBEBE1|nr:2-hydroxyacid dehydrogenase [Massilia sp. Gc5]